MPFIHFDEAKAAAIETAKQWLGSVPSAIRLMLVVDLLGSLRLALWTHEVVATSSLEANLAERCSTWWTGEILHVSQADDVTGKLYHDALAQARSDPEEPRFAVLDRHRSRTAWFSDLAAPLWNAPEEGPPIVVFYSFKGGLGRSTALASFAIQRAQAGERVCVLDFDLDSPGVGRLLSADSEGLTSRWGVVDFLLERTHPGLMLKDYYHRCDRVSGQGAIDVFPSGKMDEEYADKLARVDFEERPTAADNGLVALLQRVRVEMKPQWILVDARTGISEPAGQLLAGLAHLHVLLGTTQEQSWQGLRRVLDRLGKQRVEAGNPQAEVLLVQAMVPFGDPGKVARETFSSRLERECTDRYFVSLEDGVESDPRFWDTGDMDSRDAPHVPVPVEYDQKLADFEDISVVSDVLQRGAWAAIAERISSRFATENE